MRSVTLGAAHPTQGLLAGCTLCWMGAPGAAPPSQELYGCQAGCSPPPGPLVTGGPAPLLPFKMGGCEPASESSSRPFETCPHVHGCWGSKVSGWGCTGLDASILQLLGFHRLVCPPCYPHGDPEWQGGEACSGRVGCGAPAGGWGAGEAPHHSGRCPKERREQCPRPFPAPIPAHGQGGRGSGWRPAPGTPSTFSTTDTTSLI